MTVRTYREQLKKRQLQAQLASFRSHELCVLLHALLILKIGKQDKNFITEL